MGPPMRRLGERGMGDEEAFASPAVGQCSSSVRKSWRHAQSEPWTSSCALAPTTRLGPVETPLIDGFGNERPDTRRPGNSRRHGRMVNTVLTWRTVAQGMP